MALKWNLIVAALSASLLASCANNPSLRDQPRLTRDNIEETVNNRAVELSETWARNDPAITYFDREKAVFIQKANAIPIHILDKKVTAMRINEGSTLRDLAGLLHPYGIAVMFSSEEDISERPFSIRNYSGTVGELLSIVENLHNITASSVGGDAIQFTSSATFIASMPQNEGVLDSIEQGVTSLGAKEVKTNKLTGSLIYTATSRQQALIQAYLNRFYESFAAVRMQVTVFSVSLDEQLSDGFNWSELDVVLGHVQAAHAGGVVEQFLNSLSGNNQSTGTNGIGNGINTGTGTGTGIGTDTSNTNSPSFGYNTRYAGSSVSDIRGYTWLKPEGFQVGAHNNNVSVSVVMNWLNQYGNTRAEQSAFLETITGKETVIRSQKKIPFISSESTTLVGNLSPVATQNTETSSEETGIKIEFSPFYDPSSQEITIDLQVQLKNLVGYTSLTSASGNQFRRPDIQEQEFPTTVRMKVGETKLLGGVVFETLIENRAENNKIKFKGSDYVEQIINKSAMFILIRPAVQVFRQPSDAEKGSE